MGESYTNDEIELILKYIDTDGLKVVEFPEFIRWWCGDFQYEAENENDQ
jgi:Ca2+-binding EF-hand superfamily protein